MVIDQLRRLFAEPERLTSELSVSEMQKAEIEAGCEAPSGNWDTTEYSERYAVAASIIKRVTYRTNGSVGLLGYIETYRQINKWPDPEFVHCPTTVQRDNFECSVPDMALRRRG